MDNVNYRSGKGGQGRWGRGAGSKLSSDTFCPTNWCFSDIFKANTRNLNFPSGCLNTLLVIGVLKAKYTPHTLQAGPYRYTQIHCTGAHIDIPKYSAGRPYRYTQIYSGRPHRYIQIYCMKAHIDIPKYIAGRLIQTYPNIVQGGSYKYTQIHCMGTIQIDANRLQGGHIDTTKHTAWRAI